jgi:hypothetical protein
MNTIFCTISLIKIITIKRRGLNDIEAPKCQYLSAKPSFKRLQYTPPKYKDSPQLPPRRLYFVLEL